MHKINLLDCTLRDGGYINGWNFGKEPKINICRLMVDSGVEYLEIGYMKNQECPEDYTLYRNNAQMAATILQKGIKTKYVAMVNYGEYPIEVLENRSEDSIDAIRVAFAKKDVNDVYEYCLAIKEKGYELFVQPMGTDKYTDVEFIEMINRINEISPRAFYVVDSFGVMEKKDLIRYLSIADNNLKSDIAMGYHSHNNLQQAYGNTQYMLEQGYEREIFVDASIYGMGRGAGNLNTELFARYLNSTFGKKYNITSMLEVIDQYIGKLRMEKFWGYSLPYYLSAKHNCHPNYARFFSEKNTLSNKSMNELLASLTPEEKVSYSSEKAEKAYRAYQEMYVDDKEMVDKIRKELADKDILILAPGGSLTTRKDEIKHYINEKKPVVISINVANKEFRSDYLMCTNEKRYRRIESNNDYKLILSSNLGLREDALIINYSSYLCQQPLIADNPTLILFNLLASMGISKLTIAGFDGYGASTDDNYFDKDLVLGTSLNVKLNKNKYIKEELKKYEGVLEINFLTPSRYVED